MSQGSFNFDGVFEKGNKMSALVKYAAKKGEKGWAEKLKGLIGDGAEKVKAGAKKAGKKIGDEAKKTGYQAIKAAGESPRGAAAIGGAGAAAGYAAGGDGDEDDMPKKKKKYPWE